MEHEFWHNAWEQGKTGWRQRRQNTRMQRHWPGLELPAGSTVLVPLCGDTPDMLWLRDAGFKVVGCDLSAVALRRFLHEHQLEHTESVSSDGSITEFQADNLRLICGDFLALTPVQIGPVAAVYDRAATVAMPAELRQTYAEKIIELTRHAEHVDSVQGLLISFSYDQQKMNGPPFSVPTDEIHRLYGASFVINCVGSESGESILGNLRERGLDELEESVYHLIRR
ncbi:MAG: thiopurine S-methyltransferase [Granulosicoccus sp.]|nr:thiopurine S-methyltransferase [Granulosicoccus sp.]